MTVAFWIIVVAALASFALFLGLPVLRWQGNDSSDADVAERLRDRLAGIDADRVAGLITDAAAEEAIVEAKRAAIGYAIDLPDRSSKHLRFAALAFLGLAPVIATAVYSVVGNLKALDAGAVAVASLSEPSDIAAMSLDAREEMIRNMVVGLEARLADNPDDIEGWRMAARSQVVLGRLDDSADSYRELFKRTEGDLADWRNFAGVLIAQQSDGDFPADADFLEVLEEIEARNPGDPFVLFYRGGAAMASGEPARAAAMWRQLLEIAPEDAPVRDTLVTMIREAEKSAELD